MLDLPRLRLVRQGDDHPDEHRFRSNWTGRTRLLAIILFWMMAIMTYVIWKGTDSNLYSNSLWVFGVGIVTLTGQYIFGKAWDNRNFLAFASMRGAVGNSASTPPAPVDDAASPASSSDDSNDGPPRN